MTINGRVSPFRNLRIEACLPAPRSLSQATTSFIASRCQGIHHTLLIASSTRPSTGIKQSPASCQVHALERLPTTHPLPRLTRPGGRAKPQAASEQAPQTLALGVTNNSATPKNLSNCQRATNFHVGTPKRLTFPADAGRAAWVRHAARLEAGSGSILVLF